MKRILYFLVFVLFFSCNSLTWIRKLPAKAESSPILVKGLWKRKTNPKSAMNSSWHKNSWSEEIYFDRPKSGSFVKSYRNTNYYGSKKVEERITGRGTYQVKGNWILLETRELQHIKEEKSQTCCEEFKPYSHKLLYYYYAEEKAILPMLYEAGYQEQNFGVSDGASGAYQVDENFQTYLQIYTHKEYHSHAYFLVGEN